MKKSFLFIFTIICASISLNAQDDGFKLDEYGLCTLKGEFQSNVNLPEEKATQILLNAYTAEFVGQLASTKLVSSTDSTYKYSTSYNFTFVPFPVPYSENLIYSITIKKEKGNRFSYLIEYPVILITKVNYNETKDVAFLLKEKARLQTDIDRITNDETLKKGEKKHQTASINKEINDINDLLNKSYDSLMEKFKKIKTTIQ